MQWLALAAKKKNIKCHVSAVLLIAQQGIMGRSIPLRLMHTYPDLLEGESIHHNLLTAQRRPKGCVKCRPACGKKIGCFYWPWIKKKKRWEEPNILVLMDATIECFTPLAKCLTNAAFNQNM